MPIVYLGIGSNLGSREENCEHALRLLKKSGLKIIKLSSMIETEPWGVKDQPKFINMAVKAETGLSPDNLLKLLKKIESDMGRLEATRWGPRLIDLDILFYDNLAVKIENLEIPHPGIEERDFVLIPMNEIAPDLVHPVLKKKIKELLHKIDKA